MHIYPVDISILGGEEELRMEGMEHVSILLIS